MDVKRLVIKIPTRERGLDFVDAYLENITNPFTQIWLTLDEDEWGMKDPGDYLKFPNELDVRWVIGKSESKIGAYNRDIDLISEMVDWDVIMVGSDDMIPEKKGFDQRILDDMWKYYPNTDGALWYRTENSLEELRRRYNRDFYWGSSEWAKRWICMLPIMGRKYYERFRYVYHTSYKSFWCDNEWTDVARRWGLIRPVNYNGIRHRHPAWDGGTPEDLLYSKNQAHWKDDELNYNRRRLKGFPKK